MIWAYEGTIKISSHLDKSKCYFLHNDPHWIETWGNFLEKMAWQNYVNLGILKGYSEDWVLDYFQNF